MWGFRAAQKQFQVGKVQIGGLPGERPVVLIGTMFYHGQNIVQDESKGLFDKVGAERLIKAQEEFSDKTGNPHMIDVVATTPEAMVRFMDFVVGVSDAPILLDGVDPGIRIAGIDHARGVGIEDRVVYNSLTPEYKREELEKIKENRILSSILLCLNNKDFSTHGRMTAARTLLEAAIPSGVSKPMIDTVVLDIPTLGMACKAIRELKDEYGYPVGCGAHNAVAMWKGLRTKMGVQAEAPSNAVAGALSIAAGADFLLYGPIENANFIFPAVSLIDASYAELAIERGRRPDRSHPRFRIA